MPINNSNDTNGYGAKQSDLPLSGLRVLDLATFIAAPFCATMLAEFGAEVIKVEMPKHGDSQRHVGDKYKDVGLFWAQENRNKMGITCDLRMPEGQDIIKQLVKHTDILVSNFRPGTIERWNLGYEQLQKINPALIMLMISAYGQTGPYSHKPGFGRIAQAFSGFTYLAGYPDRPPVNPGSATIADYVSGLFGAFSVMIALEHRHKTGEGQCIDVALYEAMFRLLDILAPAYDKLGTIRERIGTGTTHTVPHNHNPTKDGKWVAIACTNDRLFHRLCKAMGKEQLASDPRYRTNADRVNNRDEVDNIVNQWTSTYNMDDLVKLLDDEEVPISPINSIADIFKDPQFNARDAIIEVDDPVIGKMKMPAIVPRMSKSPGMVKHLAPALGQHNKQIYGDLLGYNPDQLSVLEQKGVI